MKTNTNPWICGFCRADNHRYHRSSLQTPSTELVCHCETCAPERTGRK